MSWVTNLVENKEITYWMPDELPEKTEEWQTNQMRKSYLKSDGSITGHPGWYFGNQAYVSDEYLYHNEGWYTVIDDRPEETDENGNQYIIIEKPSSEWEIFDTHKIRKSYKKYLHNFIDKPKYEFGKVIHHSLVFDDKNMTATDTYDVSSLSQEELQIQKTQFLNMIRKIRNYILEKTDYLVIYSKEKNEELSQDFLSYRQALRDLPDNFNFSTLNEQDYNKIIQLSQKLKSFPNQHEEIRIGDLNISFFPSK